MAFVFLDRVCTSEAGTRIYNNQTIRDRAGAVEIPRDVFEDLDEFYGYKRFIYGERKKNGTKERAKFACYK